MGPAPILAVLGVEDAVVANVGDAERGRAAVLRRC